MVHATMQREFGKINQVTLIDTGATLSLICTKATPEAKEFPVQEVKILEGYNGKRSVVPFYKTHYVYNWQIDY